LAPNVIEEDGVLVFKDVCDPKLNIDPFVAGVLVLLKMLAAGLIDSTGFVSPNNIVGAGAAALEPPCTPNIDVAGVVDEGVLSPRLDPAFPMLLSLGVCSVPLLEVGPAEPFFSGWSKIDLVLPEVSPLAFAPLNNGFELRLNRSVDGFKLGNALV
jgi:hypothetical protein